ncbi:MAG: hypothetical protein KGL94_04410 [Acidobacteriota bacterium]|nr:hypothetical protein [Acidobacteriota bacterium]
MPAARQTPLGALARGLVAGAIGTAAMTVHQEIVSKLRGADSDGQTADSQAPWASAPAPARVARRILEGVFRTEVDPARIGLLTNLMHWLYGTGWGGVYGLVESTIEARPLRAGPLFGTAVWAGSYLQLVPMGIYEPPWRYPPATLANDLGYHLTYGVGVALGHRALERSL